MRPATIAGLSLLLLTSAVVAVEFSEAAASKLPAGGNKADLSEADASNLSDEELQALQEEFAVYGKYCGPGRFPYVLASLLCACCRSHFILSLCPFDV